MRQGSFTIYMKKPVGSRFGQMVIQNSPFVQISSIYRKTGRESRKLVLKTGFEEMEHEFPFGTFRPGKQYCLFRRSVATGNFPVKRPDKSCSIYRFQPDFPEAFCK